MTFFHLTAANITALLLIFVRIGAIMYTAPLFSSPRIPLHSKAAIGLLLAFLVMPIVAPDGVPLSANLWVFGLQVCTEGLVGVIIGYIANLVFAVVQMSGELQDTQTGFGFAGVVDPNVSQHSAILGQFQMVLLWVIFLAANGHHAMISAIVDSFGTIPLGAFAMNPAMAGHVFGLATTLMSVALRIGAPVIGAVLLSDVAMGLLQRTAPQLNLMAIGFQVKIATATGVTLLALPYIISALHNLVPFMHRIVYDIIG